MTIPPHLSTVTLVTDDVAAQRELFASFGWQTDAAPGDPFVLYPLGPLALALWDGAVAREALALPAGTGDGAAEPRDLALVIDLDGPDRVDAALAFASAAGARTLHVPESRGPVRRGWFLDPIGTPWRLSALTGAAPEYSAPARPAAAAVPAQLNALTLTTPDVLALRDVYERFGWRTPMERRTDIAQFQFDGAIVSAWTREEAEREIAAPLAAHGLPYRGFTLGIAVESKGGVDAALAAAEAAGATIVVEPSDQWWGGRSGYFADAGGFPWDVVWIPGAAIGAGGELRIAG